MLWFQIVNDLMMILNCIYIYKIQYLKNIIYLFPKNLHQNYIKYYFLKQYPILYKNLPHYWNHKYLFHYIETEKGSLSFKYLLDENILLKMINSWYCIYSKQIITLVMDYQLHMLILFVDINWLFNYFIVHLNLHLI